jgi:hypothetical protein
MGISAIIPVADVAAANAALRDAGFGAENFRVPLRSGNAEATHVGLHCWDNQAFLAAVQALPNVEVKTDGSHVNFAEAATEQEVEWTDQTNWFDNPIMTGDERTFDNKTWVSLIDYNPYPPPLCWREIGENPDWSQPFGGKGYPVDFTVTHNGVIYINRRPANVWEPGAFDSGWEVFGQGGGGGTEWVNTGATVVQMVAGQTYLVSEKLSDLTPDQKIKLGDKETVFKRFWSGFEDYLIIDPHVEADVGAIVYKWA